MTDASGATAFLGLLRTQRDAEAAAIETKIQQSPVVVKEEAPTVEPEAVAEQPQADEPEAPAEVKE